MSPLLEFVADWFLPIFAMVFLPLAALALGVCVYALLESLRPPRP